NRRPPLAATNKFLAQMNKSPDVGKAPNRRQRQVKETIMADDLRKDLLAIVLEEAFGYEEARIRNWLARRFDHNDWVTEGDISALQTANLIVDRIECRCAAAISATN